jgi:hypothetical protein
MYPAGELMDPNNIPTGAAPTNSLVASATSIASGQSVTLTPTSSGASYNYIDNAGFVRGPVVVNPTVTTTYTLYSNNAYGSTASTPVTVTVGTNPAPTIAFNPIGTQTYGEAPFTVAATSNSSGAMTYSVLSGGATISGQTVTLTSAGLVTLQVSQAATSSYTAGTATTSFTVNGTTPTISFSIAPQTYPESPFTITATSTSPGAITYAIASGPATIAGNTLTLTGAGSVTVTANQAASSNYNAAAASATFTVTGAAPPPVPTAPQTILFNPLPNFAHGASYQLTARTTSGQPVTYAVTDGSGFASITGNVLTVSTSGGSVTVQASSPVDPTGGYAAATPVSRSFTAQ